MSFDPASEAHVALVDEMPPWSALAGSLLLDIVPMTARRVLDLGCGTGFPLLELAERLGPETLAAGLDPWHPALARARRSATPGPCPMRAWRAATARPCPFAAAPSTSWSRTSA